MTNLKTNIIGLSRDQIKSILIDADFDKQLNMRVKQIWHWIYFRGAKNFEEMSNISQEMRNK